MNKIKYRQPIFHLGKFMCWHYWGYIDNAFVCPVNGDTEQLSQQYIGIKDKFKTEIYEGDIIHKSKQNGVWSVVYGYFGEPAFKVHNHLNSGREIETADYEDENPYFSFNSKTIIEIEVIGNNIKKINGKEN